MLKTIYTNRVNGKWEDVSSTINYDYVGKAKSGKIKLSRILALLLLLMTEDASEEESDCFESLMVMIAMYLECDGLLKLRASDDWYKLIVSANDELLTMLTSSDYSEMLD